MTLPFVDAGDGPSLLGRDWLQKIHLDWPHIGLHYTQVAPPTIESAALQHVLNKHKAVFRDELGLVKGVWPGYTFKQMHSLGSARQEQYLMP